MRNSQSKFKPLQLTTLHFTSCLQPACTQINTTSLCSHFTHHTSQSIQCFAAIVGRWISIRLSIFIQLESQSFPLREDSWDLVVRTRRVTSPLSFWLQLSVRVGFLSCSVLSCLQNRGTTDDSVADVMIAVVNAGNIISARHLNTSFRLSSINTLDHIVNSNSGVVTRQASVNSRADHTSCPFPQSILRGPFLLSS